MRIVAFFGKEILSRFIDCVEMPSVEAAEFEFFDVISGLSWYFKSLIIYLYYDLSQILRNVVIYAWFGENERCDPAHIFDVIHEHFIKWPESEIFLDR